MPINLKTWWILHQPEKWSFQWKILHVFVLRIQRWSKNEVTTHLEFMGFVSFLSEYVLICFLGGIVSKASTECSSYPFIEVKACMTNVGSLDNGIAIDIIILLFLTFLKWYSKCFSNIHTWTHILQKIQKNTQDFINHKASGSSLELGTVFFI